MVGERVDQVGKHAADFGAEGHADEEVAYDPEAVRTNVVCCDAARLPAPLLDGLRAEGVLAGTIDARTVRFMTHKDVDDGDVRRVVDAFDAIAERARP